MARGGSKVLNHCYIMAECMLAWQFEAIGYHPKGFKNSNVAEKGIDCILEVFKRFLIEMVSPYQITTVDEFNKWLDDFIGDSANKDRNNDLGNAE
jgi:hypothetical protein